jgi:lambda repressor-like predicted transcriptional regulator
MRGSRLLLGYAFLIGAPYMGSRNDTNHLASSRTSKRHASGEKYVMGIVLRTDALIREVARRGWNLADLARAAGISGATMTAARSGRPVSPASVRRIAAALTSAPPIDGVDDLLLS